MIFEQLLSRKCVKGRLMKSPKISISFFGGKKCSVRKIRSTDICSTNFTSHCRTFQLLFKVKLKSFFYQMLFVGLYFAPKV